MSTRSLSRLGPFRQPVRSDDPDGESCPTNSKHDVSQVREKLPARVR